MNWEDQNTEGDFYTDESLYISVWQVELPEGVFFVAETQIGDELFKGMGRKLNTAKIVLYSKIADYYRDRARKNAIANV